MFMQFKNYLLIIILLFCHSVIAEPLVTVSTTYYSIDGGSEKELRNEMNSKSSAVQDGKRYDAYTSWYVSWRFNWNSKESGCYITNASTSVDVKFILPEWVNENDADQQLKQKWNRYYQALIKHENGHKDFGVNAAREIENAILTMQPQSSCSLLEETANGLAHEIIKNYVAREKAYDRDTNHGMNDGAVFP